MKSLSLIAFLLFAGLALAAAPPPPATAPRTEFQYLSGHGPADAVAWNFEVTGGRRAGERTVIPVPSNWEQQGFGSYNYGQDDNKAREHGLYRTQFNVPADWQGRRIYLVFEGVMTDAAVTLNGQSTGPVHQGGFTRFRYNVTRLIKFGGGAANQNVLTADVAKASANPSVELAERGGDYWVFGGIYRPVYLEALPAHAIDHVAVDARADGTLTAKIALGAPPGGRTDGPEIHPMQVSAQVYDSAGLPLGTPISCPVPAGGAGRVRLHGHVAGVQPWTAETPRLYNLRLTLSQDGRPLHSTDVRIGFRTFEVHDGQGLFLNGQRVLLKGVNRGDLRPETGRALNPADCYADVRMIRSMNMNAVRTSHYPPNQAFLDACDELGLYVIDELPGWQHAYDTRPGRRILREMVTRDVNHPSVILWSNGNEGGWNPALDGDFSLYDPQHRRVLHPWNLHDGIDTRHYAPYAQLVRLLQGPNLVMPTEILHGLFDGGGGAGLEDYWNALSASKVGAGLFIWNFADAAIQRTDLGGKLDAHGTYAADGVLGPHFEKEGSYYAIRDLWSPVQFTTPTLDVHFPGTITVRNRYDFTSLADCRFTWALLRFEDGKEVILARGAAPSPDIPPHAAGQLHLNLPADWTKAEALAVTVAGPDGADLWTSVWPTAAAMDIQAARLRPRFQTRAAAPTVQSTGSLLVLAAGQTKAEFDAATGELFQLSRGDQTFPLTRGPRLIFARPTAGAEVDWQSWAGSNEREPTLQPPQPTLANVIEVKLANLHGHAAYAGFRLELSSDGQHWHTIFDGTRRPNDGSAYTFPPQIVAAARLSHIWRYDQAAPVIQSFRLGCAPARFPVTNHVPVKVTFGTSSDSAPDGPTAWIAATGGPSNLTNIRWTMRADGSLRLDCAYELRGEFLYHGITFDLPEDTMLGLRWWGQGPTRVWQNRLRGTWLGLHETRRSDQQSGVTWHYPRFAGCFAGVRWAQLATTRGALEIIPAQPDLYLRVGTPRDDHPNTTPDFPAGNFSLLHAIPAIGTKMHPADAFGPHSQPAAASGRYECAVVFNLQ